MRRHDLLAVALLLFLPTLLFGDVLLGFRNFAARDLTRYYYPTKQVYRHIVRQGEFPLWNPYFHAGQPLAANPEHEIFYPPTWLLMLPDYDLGYRLHILLHIYIALLGMYALLRSMRLRAAPAVFGASSWGMGGLFLSYVNLLPILFCAAWLPLTALFARRLLLQPNRRDFALAALFLGIQCLVAEPTTLLQTALLIGLYGLYRGWRDGRTLRNIGLVALVGLCGAAVGAVQLLAAADHLGDSARARPFEFALVQTWSMPWAKLLELVYPNVLGRAGVEMAYWGARLYEPRTSPFVYSIYPGLAAAALAAAAFFARPRGGRFVLGLVALSVLMAAGGHTPLLRFLYDAGIATSVRYPEKFILLAIFAISVLAARMLAGALEGDERIRAAAAAFALATALLAAAVSLLVRMRPDVWLGTFGLPSNEFTMALGAMAWSDWMMAALHGFLLFILLVTMRMARKHLWLAAGLLFVCWDVGRIAQQINPRLPSAFFTEAPPSLHPLLPDRDDYRLFHEADWGAGGPEGRRYFSGGVAPYFVVRNGLFPPMPAAWGIRTALERDYDETALLPTRDLTAAMLQVRAEGRPDWWRPFVAMSNVRYRAVFRPFEEERDRVGGDYTRAEPVEFVEVGRHPRYYFADQIVPVADLDDFVRKVTAGSHAGRVAFVTGSGFAPAAGEVLAVSESPNTAVIDVLAGGRAFLVMSVTPHKYWHVTIDGRKVRPVVTNIGYQGVVVPAGRHRVAMQYRNGVIAAVWPVSAAAAVMLLVAAAVPSRRPRRAEAE
ncbi:MAG TPA: hypothetical protein VM779_04085 [Thermoanaerobaculia bacterium]|nr:hypothetical protein [Thermoanaerobaculia bacterium]